MKNLFRSLGLALLLPLFVVLLLSGVSACSMTGSNTPGAAADVASLLVLEDAYDDAKQTLTDRLDSFPTETGLALLALEKKTDALVADYKSAWSTPTSIVQIDVLMLRTSQLYGEGQALVAPHLASMTIEEQQRLKRLDVTWTRVDESYQRWQSDPAAQEKRQMLGAGVELATALLLVLG
jgi:hypothetical protein